MNQKPYLSSANIINLFCLISRNCPGSNDYIGHLVRIQDTNLNGSFQVAAIQLLATNFSVWHKAAVETEYETFRNPTGAMVAGWVSHSLGNAALPRRTHIPVIHMSLLPVSTTAISPETRKTCGMTCRRSSGYFGRYDRHLSYRFQQYQTCGMRL